jgi:glycosyltransferase 2 family protein
MTGHEARSLLTAPELRFGVGVAGLVLSGLAVHEHSIGRREAAVFRLVNELPDAIYPPVWVLMQSGNLFAGPIAGAVAGLAGRPRLGLRLALGGVTSWALSKAIKRVYRRPRPNGLIPAVHDRGREATGLGYVSGHAGVAVALGVAASTELGPLGRAGALLVPPLVGLSRIYVGAHLPLDTVGGAAMGLAVEATVDRALRIGAIAVGRRRRVRTTTPESRVPGPRDWVASHGFPPGR